MNNSSTGGYVTPIINRYDSGLRYDAGHLYNTEVQDDLDFETYLQTIIAGVLGISGNLVRPRWQTTPANRPSVDTDWVAVGVTDSKEDTYAHVWHDNLQYDALLTRSYDSGVNYPAVAHYDSGATYDSGLRYDYDVSPVRTQQADIVQRNEELTVLVSCYGKHAAQSAGRIRDGLSIAQNREALFNIGAAVVSAGSLQRMPELVNEQWYRRVDLTLVMRRQVVRRYPIYNVLSSAGTITADTVNSSFLAVNP